MAPDRPAAARAHARGQGQPVQRAEPAAPAPKTLCGAAMTRPTRPPSRVPSRPARRGRGPRAGVPADRAGCPQVCPRARSMATCALALRRRRSRQAMCTPSGAACLRRQASLVPVPAQRYWARRCLPLRHAAAAYAGERMLGQLSFAGHGFRSQPRRPLRWARTCLPSPAPTSCCSRAQSVGLSPHGERIGSPSLAVGRQPRRPPGGLCATCRRYRPGTQTAKAAGFGPLAAPSA